MGKKLGLGALILLAGGVMAAYYYWSQLTKVPDWYESQESSGTQVQDETTITTADAAVKRKIVDQVQQQVGQEEVEIKLNQQDINDIVVSQSQDNPVLRNAKGINTEIKEDSLEIGAVVNTRELAEREARIDQALDKFPLLKNKDLYVAIEGDPQVENGKLQFDENTIIKVGNLRMTVREASQRLGVPPETIEKKLALQLQRLNVQDLAIENEELVVKTAP